MSVLAIPVSMEECVAIWQTVSHVTVLLAGKTQDVIEVGVPYSKVHGANMGPIWGRQDPDRPHVGPRWAPCWPHKPCYPGCCWRRDVSKSLTLGYLNKVLDRVRCRHNAVNFLINSHNTQNIARPWGRGMGCVLWVWSPIDVLLLSSQRRVISW